MRTQIDRAVELALTTPMPDPATAATDVFYDGSEGELTLGRGEAPWSGFQGKALPASR